MWRSVYLVVPLLATLGAIQRASAARTFLDVAADGKEAASNSTHNDDSTHSGNSNNSRSSAMSYVQTWENMGPPWPDQINKIYTKVKYLSVTLPTVNYLIKDRVTSTTAVLKLMKVWHKTKRKSLWVQKYHLDHGIDFLLDYSVDKDEVERSCTRARWLTTREGLGSSRWSMCFENGLVDPTNGYIVTEDLGSTNLRLWQNKFRTKHQLPPVTDVTRIAKMLLEAVAELEKGKVQKLVHKDGSDAGERRLSYTHRDIKDTNIKVLERNGKPYVKLADLMTMELDQTFRNAYYDWAGSKVNQPPETLGQFYNRGKSQYEVAHSIDIYAIGQVIFKMLCATKSQRNNNDFGIYQIVEETYGNGNKFKIAKEVFGDQEIKDTNGQLLKAFEAYLGNEDPYKHCRSHFLWIEHKNAELFEEYKPILLIMGQMLNKKKNRPGAQELLQQSVFQGVDTTNEEIEAEVKWVADHMDAQIEFEEAREKKFKKINKEEHRYRKVFGMRYNQLTFHASDLNDMRKRCKAEVAVNPVHVFKD